MHYKIGEAPPDPVRDVLSDEARAKLKPAERSECGCDSCVSYLTSRATPGVYVRCSCGESMTFVYYGHMICPYCKTELYVEDDLAYEHERDRKQQHLIDHGSDGRVTW